MGASAFPKIYALGKVEIQDIFKTEVEVTEKIDGSQFCFGRDETGEIVMRSKGQQLFEGNIPNMFQKAYEYIAANQELIKRHIAPGTYVYAEFLNKPKHKFVAVSMCARVSKSDTRKNGRQGETPYKSSSTHFAPKQDGEKQYSIYKKRESLRTTREILGSS